MKFVILLLFSPFVTSSFTSLCPQQPNNVVVNCNNQNPFGNPLFPGGVIPGRARVLDIGYNKPPVGSKLEFQLQRSDSSEESSESDESRESSEETNDHRIPFYAVSHPQIPAIHTTTTVDNRLDFMRRGLGGAFANNLRSLPKNHVPGQVTVTSDTDVSETMTTGQHVVVDETHGHGHSGQYNHNVHDNHGHHHEHNHGHTHDHHGSGHIHIPTHITNPAVAISGAHIVPDYALTIDDIFGAAAGSVVNYQGPSPTVQVAGIPISDSDRLILTRRGYRTLDRPHKSRKTSRQLNPDELLTQVIAMLSVPTVVQDGLNTEINCDPIPIVSGMPQTAVLQGTAEQTLSQNEMLPAPVQGSSTLITTENVAGSANFPQAHGESTVTKVTTTKVEEQRPITAAIGAEESSGSTVTKVTTTKLEERPTVETVVHEKPAQTGSTVTKVTTTTTEERPAETIRPVKTGSTVTKVTTTTVEKRPTTEEVIGETIVQGTPVQTGFTSGSTVTKVTTTTTDGRPILPETIIHETPVQTGSTLNKVTTTTTTTEDRPITSNFEAMLGPDVITGKHELGT